MTATDGRSVAGLDTTGVGPVGLDMAWAEALTTLETDVATAEAMLDHDHLPTEEAVARLAAWRPPTGLGPLPTGLLDRAQALADRQRSVVEAITRAMIANRRHMVVLDETSTPPPSPPVYLDAEG
ncbi:MAG: hypothetical protein FWH11_08185 [Micrococcales bacterium]|nr:hypothetical protein [Micrococcales bacterium]